MNQFDLVTGFFEPKRIETLREEARPFIGKLMVFEALWEIESGPYAGQWAMQPRFDKQSDSQFFGWIPEEDINEQP